MTYALVTIQKPSPQTSWPNGLDFYVRLLPKDEGVRQIAESAWLIRLDTDLLALANLVRLAHEATMPCHALFFDHEPTVCSWPVRPS